ncbi:hypothetical protein CEXT_473171 [Caerostris extrusa]|uniref:Uncharacterized protein n=1 Tax=Caerostris extrusa TaxID=172846 RepID=A0AAV4S443_CAEEX|nr:hypothetical protein CEXT_473171 [Caerostris extrusa]
MSPPNQNTALSSARHSSNETEDEVESRRRLEPRPMHPFSICRTFFPQKGRCFEGLANETLERDSGGSWRVVYCEGRYLYPERRVICISGGVSKAD